jgi:hypothetical protein
MKISAIRLSCIEIIFLVCSLVSRNCFCQSLQDIIDSPVINSSSSSTSDKGDDAHSTWFHNKQSLASLFTSRGKGGALLLEWLGEISLPDVKLIKKDFQKNTEFVGFTTTYNVAGSIIDLEVLVPHPKSIDLVQAKLISKFSNLEPPDLKIESLEKINIRHYTGVFYEHKSSQCSLLIKLPEGCVLNFSSTKCSDKKAIVRLGELLFLDRLSTKLSH